MKLSNLYLEEAAQGGILKILWAALEGTARAILYLTAIVNNGLMNGAVIKGEVKPSDGLRGTLEVEKNRIKNLFNKLPWGASRRAMKQMAKLDADLAKTIEKVAEIEKVDKELATTVYSAIDTLRTEWEADLPDQSDIDEEIAAALLKEYEDLVMGCADIVVAAKNRIAKAQATQTQAAPQVPSKLSTPAV